MKTLEKLLAKPMVQRIVYLLLLMACMALYSSNGVMNRFQWTSFSALLSLLLLIMPVALLAGQFYWNKVWLWRLLCGLLIGFTLWLATLSMSQVVAGAGSGARSLVWAVGVVGFTAVLVLVLAFLNWMLLHMKPKK